MPHDTAVANHHIPPSKQQARPSFLPSYSPVNPDAIVRVTYSVAGQAIAVRVSGDPVAGNNGLFYIYGDHLGSTNVLSDLNGAEVGNSRTRYLPFGDYRGAAPTQTITDRDFTGQKENRELGLLYYNARYYVPGIGRFASADTIVPDPTNPQSYNRYSYTYNNPIKYTDPTGHCVFSPPYDTAICIGLLALALTGDSEPPPSSPHNPPKNAIVSLDCDASLPDCFGDDMALKDFSENGEENPIPIDEFEDFADKLAEDLYTHDLSWPGFNSGRHTYDTPFYNFGGSEKRGTKYPEGIYSSSQQVCIETLRCSGRSSVNYIAQGMWAAKTGEPNALTDLIATVWKLSEYRELPSDDVYYWIQYGYDYYQRWEEEQNSSH